MQTAALILGILALAFLFVPVANVIVSPMFGIAALVLGLISHRAALARKEDGIRGKAGFITGVAALAISIVLIIVIVGLIRSACDKCSSGCDWGRKSEVSDLRYEDLPDELKKEIRDEVRLEVRKEMAREREERAERWKSGKPWTDEEWRKAFEERIDEWVEWFDKMPIHEDVKTAAPRGEQDPATVPAEAPGEPAEQPAEEKKPAKKPAKLPDTTYPGEALE